MAGIVDSIKHVYGDFTSGKCVENFKNMSFGDQTKTVLKVAAIALLAGIVAGVLGGFGGGFIGTVLGLGFAAAVGTAAFAYFTSDEHVSLSDKFGALAKKGAALVKQGFEDVKKAL
jgi:hypothetical protein